MLFDLIACCLERLVLDRFSGLQNFDHLKYEQSNWLNAMFDFIICKATHNINYFFLDIDLIFYIVFFLKELVTFITNDYV